MALIFTLLTLSIIPYSYAICLPTVIRYAANIVTSEIACYAICNILSLFYIYCN